MKRQKSLALLLDPDKCRPDDLQRIKETWKKGKPDYVFIGGSLTSTHPGMLIQQVKKDEDIPVVLFPGNLLQLTDKADGILLLSLISGRNPELLIGNHVIAAPFLKRISSEIIPTGYILISCGVKTSVEYISQTEAIPCNKPDIVVATAIAGEMLGLKTIYLEGGSGASHPVPSGIIKSVKESVNIPLIVGGGLRKASQIREAYESGADMVVLGNGYEDNPLLLEEAIQLRNEQ